MEKRCGIEVPRCGILAGLCFALEKVMSRKDAVVLASRTLAVLLTVWALTDVSYLPERVHSFIHYFNQEVPPSIATQYLRHYYLIELGFLVTRIVGYALVAKWLYKVGPEVEELLLPSELGEHSVQS
jgi:hypothetical protein